MCTHEFFWQKYGQLYNYDKITKISKKISHLAVNVVLYFILEEGIDLSSNFTNLLHVHSNKLFLHRLLRSNMIWLLKANL